MILIRFTLTTFLIFIFPLTLSNAYAQFALDPSSKFFTPTYLEKLEMSRDKDQTKKNNLASKDKVPNIVLETKADKTRRQIHSELVARMERKPFEKMGNLKQVQHRSDLISDELKKYHSVVNYFSKTAKSLKNINKKINKKESNCESNSCEYLLKDLFESRSELQDNHHFYRELGRKYRSYLGLLLHRNHFLIDKIINSKKRHKIREEFHSQESETEDILQVFLRTEEINTFEGF